MKLRKLFTKDWVHVSTGLVSEGWGIRGLLKLHVHFLEIVVGRLVRRVV